MGKHKLHGAVATAISSFNEGAIHMSQVLKKLAMEPNQLMYIFINVIDSIRIQKATKVSISSSKSIKKSKMGFKNDKRTIMRQKVRLLILKHIKLEDMWFSGSWHLSCIFIMFSMYFGVLMDGILK